jgi:flagellar hook-associated protein 2
MASVTLSGFNNIDFSAILEAVMTQERVPFTALGTKKQALQAQNTQLGTLASKLSSLQNAAEDLAAPDSLSVLSATSSDTNLVGVSTSSGTTAGVYDVVVNSKAKAQVTASTSVSGPNDVVATGGSLTLLVNARPPVNIAVTGGMTLSQLADAINSTDDAPVSAAVVQVTPGSFRLVLTSKHTGTEDAFTMTSTLNGGTGVTFADNGNGVYGEAGDSNAVNASDASVTVNNVQVTSSSNTLEQVIPGVTMTLNNEDSTKNVRVTVSRNASSIRDKVDDVVKSYNELLKFVKDQRVAALAGNTNVSRDPMVRGLYSDLRNTILGEHGDGTVKRLAGVGIGFNRDGEMVVDRTVFDAAIDDDPAAVQTLFAGTASGVGSDDGAFDALAALVDSYTGADGLLKEAQERLDDQVKSISNRMDVLDAQLNIRRDALQKEFIAADQAMSQLNSQVNALSSLNNQYRLF